VKFAGTCIADLSSCESNPNPLFSGRRMSIRGKKSPGAIFDIAPAMARRATAMDGGRKKVAAP
jgi:hypothetical protein